MKGLFLFFLLSFLVSCATYYQLNYEFNQNFEDGFMDAAEKVLESNPKAEKGKEKFLYFLNRGTVAAMLDKPELSNAYFEKAFLFGEDYQINYLTETGALLFNPTLIEYKGEDHEHLMLLYYKALNFLKMGDRESALIECRRLNERLIKLNQKYKSDLKYKRDAFIHNLMGLIYDADQDYNNAFIAYRNAHEIYKNEYIEFFDISTPEQLKKDILRTAYLIGFHEELTQFEQEFSMKHIPSKEAGGDLIFFWNNGLSPVKYEFSINFTIVHGDRGMVTFVDKESGFNFPFYMSSDDESDGGLGDLEFYRMAIPKYKERVPAYSQAFLFVDSTKFPLEIGEDINQIAFHALNQRMALELGKSVLRLALKKAVEKAVREEDEDWGATLGIFNALTEKADTRNWQTMPHSISYTRAKLVTGTNEVTLKIGPESDVQQSHTFHYNIKRNETIFQAFYSLESIN